MSEKNEKVGLPVIIDDCHELLAWLVPQLDQFPRQRRFTVASKLRYKTEW